MAHARCPQMMASQWAARARLPLLRALHSGATPTPNAVLRLLAAAPIATELVAHYFASSLRAGDCYLLHGDVGAGKSFFSRAFVRAAARDDALPVPSPTFLLQNTYTDHQGPPIQHYDLYRLTQPQSLARLDLPTALPAAVSLIEWPDRLGDATPAQHLAVSLAILSAAEQQAVEGRLPAASAPRDEEEDEPEDDEQDEYSSDWRWRRIELAAHGERWERALAPLEEHVRLRGPELGLWLEEAVPGSLV